jgi:WD40 repeat protein
MRRSARHARDASSWFAPLVFSPDGSRLAGAGTSGGAIAIWTLATGARLDIAGGAGDVEQLAFSADGQTLYAAGSDGRLRAIAVPGGAERAVQLPDALEAVVVGPTGAITASVDQRVRTGDRVLFGFGDVATALALDGGWLASGAQDGALRLDALATGETLAVEGGRGAILTLAFGGGRLVAGDAGGAVVAYDLGARRGRVLATHRNAVGSVAISPDGTHVAAASEDGVVREWVEAVPRDEAGLRAWLAARR